MKFFTRYIKSLACREIKFVYQVNSKQNYQKPFSINPLPGCYVSQFPNIVTYHSLQIKIRELLHQQRKPNQTGRYTYIHTQGTHYRKIPLLLFKPGDKTMTWIAIRLNSLHYIYHGILYEHEILI